MVRRKYGFLFFNKYVQTRGKYSISAVFFALGALGDRSMGENFEEENSSTKEKLLRSKAPPEKQVF